MSLPVKRIAITGAGGAIGYAAVFRIAKGAIYGPNQPVELRLLELPGKPLDSLKGVCMELKDIAPELLRGIVATSDPHVAFEGADVALMFGARPRGKGMQRGDLLRANARIFKDQGTALGRAANPSARVVVVGNPANTNALITSRFACTGRGVVDPDNITAMTRLDHNRSLSQIADRARATTADVEKFAIWGNHSDTMWPDVSHATVCGVPIADAIKDPEWLDRKFIETVRKRGSAVIEARGSSSAGSAANAAIEHARDWIQGTNGKWTSMAVNSDGSYGVNTGLYSSFPVTCEGGKYKIVQGLKINERARKMIDASRDELIKERDIAFKELGL